MKSLLCAVPLAQGAAALAVPFPDAARERRSALAAEARQDWAAALLHYETIYDSTVTDEAARAALRAKFAELRPRVAPNADPKKAGVWKVKAFAFRTLDFAWKDQEKKEHHVRYRLREDEIEGLRKAQSSFAERVWSYSSGSLRIAWDLEVIEQPLTRLDGEQSFWPGPGACMPYFTRLKPGDAQTLFVYAKVHAEPGKDDPCEDLPLALLGGAFGVLPETKGATYIGINMVGFKSTGGIVEGEPSGEAEMHEWLHSAQWTLDDFQGYPGDLMVTSDGGRVEGEAGGDPCFRRRKEETSWMRFYAHIMQTHVTRKMWRELSLTRPADNVWASTACREFLALGPFAWSGKPNYGLDEPFIDESALAAFRAIHVPPGLKWRPVRASGRMLDLTEVYAAQKDHLAYLLVSVRARKPTPAQVRIGSDDGCKVWQNGRQILATPAPRACGLDQDIVDVTLNRGDNLFVLKVTNLDRGWGAIFRVTDRQGQPLPAVQYRLPVAR